MIGLRDSQEDEAKNNENETNENKQRIAQNFTP